MTANNTSPRSPDDGRALLRKAEVARRLGVTIWTIDRWAKSGLYPSKQTFAAMLRTVVKGQ
jgi:hypothetical protein